METMGSEVVEEGATGTMAGRRKPVLPDGRRAACAKTRVEKTKEGRVYDSLPAINVPEERFRVTETREKTWIHACLPVGRPWIASHKVGGYGLSPWPTAS